MKRIDTVLQPPSLNIELVACVGTTTHVTGLHYGSNAKGVPTLVTLVPKKAPVLRKLPVHPAAFLPLERGFLFVGTDLSVFHDSKQLSDALLKRALAHPSSGFPHSQVAISDERTAFALIAAKKRFELRKWVKGSGWSTVGEIPELDTSNVVLAAHCAWDSRRNVLVVTGRTGEKPRVAEFDGAAWKVFPARHVGVASHGVLNPLSVVGGADVIALNPSPTLLLGEGLYYSGVAQGRDFTLEAAVGNGRIRQLRNEYDATENRVVWLVEEESLAGVRDSAEFMRQGEKRFKKTAPVKKPQPKKKATLKDAVALNTLFKPGLALCVVDALLAQKKKVFDYDAWIEGGLDDGTLTLDDTEDEDRLRAWKAQAEYDLDPKLHDALVSLTIERSHLTAIKKLDLSLQQVINHFCSQWDGESELSAPVTFAGISALEGLEQVQTGEALDPRPLLDCKTLKTVEYWFHGTLKPAHRKTLLALRARGVTVKALKGGEPFDLGK